jgi:hypothetical protein
MASNTSARVRKRLARRRRRASTKAAPASTVTALVLYQGPECSSGVPLGVVWDAVPWVHCPGCMLKGIESIREFWDGVRAGDWNASGYTKAAWKHAGYPASEWATATRD